MLTLDGSHGEGGGQLVRTALALACVTATAVRVERIRAGRPSPGLAAQHLAGVRLLAQMCDAGVSGAAVGSTELTFEPGPLRSGEFPLDVGTAGSVTLVAQCALPAALHAPGEVAITVLGGTDVRWSPPSDFVSDIFTPAARLFGADFEYRVERRGYYPQGGGVARLRSAPSRLRGASVVDPLRAGVSGACHSSNLAEHVCRRMVDAAQKELGRNVNVCIDRQQGGPSTGVGLVLWSGHKAADALGELGLPAEEVGKRAARGLAKELAAPGALDPRLADQLIPLMALADGPSEVTATALTQHARTNAWVCEQMLGVGFRLEEGPPARISCPGRSGARSPRA